MELYLFIGVIMGNYMCPKNIAILHEQHLTQGKKKSNSIVQGKLLCKNTASCIIGSTVITLSLKPAWRE